MDFRLIIAYLHLAVFKYSYRNGKRGGTQSLPDVPVQIAVWSELKLHGDGHVRFERCFYSAPFNLVHRKLWAKTTDTTVCIYCDLELVAVHPRLRKPGSRSTVDEHLPPEAIAYKIQDPPSGVCAKPKPSVLSAIALSGASSPTGCWTTCGRPRESSASRKNTARNV